MILVNRGEAYIYADVTYRIGDSVVANDTSPYQGLFGIITEIRCGKDNKLRLVLNEGSSTYD